MNDKEKKLIFTPKKFLTKTPKAEFIQFNSHLFIQYLLLFPLRPSQFPLTPLALVQSKFPLPPSP